MKKDPIVKSGLQNLDDNSKDGQIQSIKNAKQAFLEMIHDDPERFEIIELVDFYINKSNAFGLSKKLNVYSFYEVCNSVYIRFGAVNSRLRFHFFKSALGGVFRSILSSNEKLRQLAEFEIEFSQDFSNLDKKYIHFLEDNPIDKIDENFFSSKSKDEKTKLVEELSADIAFIVYSYFEKRSYYAVYNIDVLNDNKTFLSLLDCINNKGYRLKELSFSIEKEIGDSMTFKLKEPDFLNSVTNTFFNYYELTFMTKPNGKNYEETIKMLDKDILTDKRIEMRLIYELVTGIYMVFVKYDLVLYNSNKDYHIGKKDGKYVSLNANISNWIHTLLVEVAGRPKKDTKKGAVDAIKDILGKQKPDHVVLPPIPIDYRTIYTRAKLRERRSSMDLFKSNSFLIITRIYAILKISFIVSFYAKQQHYDETFMMLDAWNSDIQDRLNDIQKPPIVQYSDVSVIIQDISLKTRDFINFLKNSQVMNSQFESEYIQFYDELKSLYERLLKATKKAMNIQFEDVRIKGLDLIYSYQNSLDSKVWTYIEKKLEKKNPKKN